MNGRQSHRIRSGLARLSIGGHFPQEAVEVQDVSLRGVGARVQTPLATDQEVPIQLTHPVLQDRLQLTGRVTWCRMAPGDPHPHVGLEFGDTSETQRMDLRRIQAAEVSCRVLAGERMAGFVLTTAEGTWALYDANTVKVATLLRTTGGFQVSFLGARPEDSIHHVDAENLPEAVALALGLDVQPLILPPEGGRWIPISTGYDPLSAGQAAGAREAARVAQERREPEPTAEAAAPAGPEEGPPPPVGSPSRAFHTVSAGGYLVGHLAVTSIDDTWSLYDESWNEVALLTPYEGRWKVSFLGTDKDDSLDYLIAKSFTGAVALAYDLKLPPEIDPPLSEDDAAASSGFGGDVPEEAEDATEDEEAPLPPDRAHHAVVDAQQGVVGYVAPAAGVPGYWSVYTTSREKIAMVAPEGSRQKVMFIGTDPNESLDYMVSRTFLGALALTFELEALPTLDPPL